MEETEVGTQTDAFLDRPPTPLFVPAKTGQDVATQIEDGDVSYLYYVVHVHALCTVALCESSLLDIEYPSPCALTLTV